MKDGDYECLFEALKSNTSLTHLLLSPFLFFFYFFVWQTTCDVLCAKATTYYKRKIESASCKCLYEALKSNSTLRSFALGLTKQLFFSNLFDKKVQQLGDIRIDYGEGMEHIAQALKENVHLTELSFCLKRKHFFQFFLKRVLFFAKYSKLQYLCRWRGTAF